MTPGDVADARTVRATAAAMRRRYVPGEGLPAPPGRGRWGRAPAARRPEWRRRQTSTPSAAACLVGKLLCRMRESRRASPGVGWPLGLPARPLWGTHGGREAGRLWRFPVAHPSGLVNAVNRRTFPPLPSVSISWRDVYGTSPQGDEAYLTIESWEPAVQFFVGRNGTGKTKAARAIVAKFQQAPEQQPCLFLSADRLLGMMSASSYNFGLLPQPYQGAPLGQHSIDEARSYGIHGIAHDSLYILREDPEVFLQVAALLHRAFGRQLSMQERSGFLDPTITDANGASYSLLRDEGHGLRELVILLVAAYRSDWRLLVVDEPELHLHPSLTQLWLAELERSCRDHDRKAIVITHEPRLLQGITYEALPGIWVFSRGPEPVNLGEAMQGISRETIEGSLGEQPQLVSRLVFSPRPTLVEGPSDEAALSTALQRLVRIEAIAQTDLIPCGGGAGVAAWFRVATALRLDVRAVADLDVIFDGSFRTAMDSFQAVREAYRSRLHVQSARTSEVLHPIILAMRTAGVGTDRRSRTKWLASIPNSVDFKAARARRDAVLDLWKSNGVWLHPQGRLEEVLGLTDKTNLGTAREAAAKPGSIDDVARFAAYQLDLQGDVEVLLGVEVERIAQAVLRELRLDPSRMLASPPGETGAFDDRLVEVRPLGEGRHRIVVRHPSAYTGWFVDFDRDTPAANLILHRPNKDRR